VRFAQGSLRPDLIRQAADRYALREELLSALAELPAGGDLVGERLTRFSAKEHADFVLEWLETWWRDVAVLAAGGTPDRLINRDKQDAAVSWTNRVGVSDALYCHEQVVATRNALQVHVNATLAMEGLWLGFKQTLIDAGTSSRSA